MMIYVLILIILFIILYLFCILLVREIQYIDKCLPPFDRNQIYKSNFKIYDQTPNTLYQARRKI